MGFVAPQPQGTPLPHEATPLGLSSVSIGVDVGQKHDPSAIAVAETFRRESGRVRQVAPQWDALAQSAIPGYSTPELETVFVVRHLERIPLGTAYPDVAQRVADVVCHELLARRTRFVYIDETGVGRPVYELIRDAIRPRRAGSGVALKAVTFTHGLSWDRRSGKLGKAFLVSRLQRLLQTHCLQLPAGHPEAQVLARELADYEIRIDNETAVDRYGAFKVGTYDDLATALGLSVLEDPDAREVTYGPQLYTPLRSAP